MSLAVQKTLGLLLLIALGLLLQKKVSSKENLKGIKILILSVALPATIFVALLKINLESSLLVLPLLALIFNFTMLFASRFVLTFFGVQRKSAKLRTLMMLLPSLAPGLSCFPFIMEYLDDSTLALAALADVGNKVFVLIILYIIANHWYRKRAENSTKESGKSKLISLLKTMLNEPINMVIITALILLAFGIKLSQFPLFMENTILRISSMMTPLVLLFIGLAVKIKRSDLRTIVFILTWRSGITFCLSALFITIFPALTPAMLLLAIVFPQSSCSFWPFAHMSGVNSLEDKENTKAPTFNINFALSILACSLPFSSVLILCIFLFSDFFIEPRNLLIIGLCMTAVSFVPYLIKKVKESGAKQKVLKGQNGIKEHLETT